MSAPIARGPAAASRGPTAPPASSAPSAPPPRNRSRRLTPFVFLPLRNLCRMPIWRFVDSHPYHKTRVIGAHDNISPESRGDEELLPSVRVEPHRFFRAGCLQ